MKCDDVVKRIPELVLDELDVEVRREVTAHVESCGACRAERERQGGAVAILRGAPDIETSAARRDDAVKAMMAARDELVERAMMARPVRWRVRAVAGLAAAALMAAVAWVTLAPGASWRVDGRDAVRPGDVVTRQESAPLTLACDEGTVELERSARVEVLGRARLRLFDGTIRVSARGEITVLDSFGGRVVVTGRAVVESDRRAVGSNASEPPTFSGDSLRVRIESGHGVLRGARGELKLEAGEKARIDRDGRPVH